MSVARSQQQVFLRLLRFLQPQWHRDFSLPRRIQQLLAGERSFGSRDRRLYRELIYTTLRYLPWIEPWLDREPERAVKITAWLAAETRDTQALSGRTLRRLAGSFLAGGAGEVSRRPTPRRCCPAGFATTVPGSFRR